MGQEQERTGGNAVGTRSGVQIQPAMGVRVRLWDPADFCFYSLIFRIVYREGPQLMLQGCIQIVKAYDHEANEHTYHLPQYLWVGFCGKSRWNRAWVWVRGSATCWLMTSSFSRQPPAPTALEMRRGRFSWECLT